MEDKNKETLCFNLSLTSRTVKRRELEALSKLKELYPYSLEEKNISLKETDEKNIYKVYVSENGFIKTKIGCKKLIIITTFLLLIGIIVVLFLRKQIYKKNLELSEQEKIERLNESKVKLAKENERKLHELEKEYLAIKKGSYENIYERIELIYSLLVPQTIIENFSIDNDNFVLDVTTKDSSQLLSKFENCNGLTQIKLSRTTVLQKDHTNISGAFVKKINTPEEKLSLEEKIKFYSEEIARESERRVKLSEKKISTYIESVRTLLHKNNCNEQYVQLKGEKENLEIELLIYSSAENILKFVKEIQNSSNKLIDIKSFHLRNSENQQRLQSVIIFKTGIALNENENADFFGFDKEFTTKEISAAMYKVPVKKIETVQAVIQKTEPEVKKEVRKIVKILSYIGLTKINGQTYVMAKDEEMNVIYKLKYVSEETSGDYCIDLGYGKFSAKIKNQWYEVRK